MYDKIIIALSLEHGISERAIAAARSLLNDGGEMFAVHVYEPVQDYVSAFVDDETLNKVATQVKARLDERVAGEEGVTPVLLQGHSGQAITDYAEEIGADCIVIGSHKPELSDFFLGSTATRIVRFAPCSVHVLR